MLTQNSGLWSDLSRKSLCQPHFVWNRTSECDSVPRGSRCRDEIRNCMKTQHNCWKRTMVHGPKIPRLERVLTSRFRPRALD